MIALIDPYTERGGGQVVLEELLRRLDQTDVEVLLAMPRDGRAKIAVPGSLVECEPGDTTDAVGSKPVVLVSNANASHIRTLRIAKRLRSSGVPCRTIAVLHNYPRSIWREWILRLVLRLFDNAIAVEPGLVKLRQDAMVPSWLSIPSDDLVDSEIVPRFRQTIKCFARPDRSKGLHILPEIFVEAEKMGYSCEVALGNSLENNSSYIETLKSSLDPWLVDGFRGPKWLRPGDIFMIPSIYGEAACLSAQEAMSRGAFVVASRVGLMPYLSPTNQGIRTFAAGQPDSAVAALRGISKLTSVQFENECLAGANDMSIRNGRWYEEVVKFLRDENDSVRGNA